MAQTLGLILGLPREAAPEERRVALTPSAVAGLVKAGFEVIVEAGAGSKAGHGDGAYREAGARVEADGATVLAEARILVRVRALGACPAPAGGADSLRDGQVLVAACSPLDDPQAIAAAAGRGATVFALELVPRITRAQSMDILSSMATIAGYKAVLLAASHLPRIFPMLMTAAGTVPAARVFVLGAGVAGLQAMATAKRLGAVVEGYDIRPVVKEQVQSVGARFVELPLEVDDAEDAGGYARAQDESFYARQRALLTEVLARSEVVITTANIPGRKAPELITDEMVAGMPAGAVIVDLAAERGGNCALTRPDEVVEAHGVTILGPTDLPSTVPTDASRMFARNVVTLLEHLYGDGDLTLDLDDEVVAGTLACHGGEVTHPRLRDLLDLAPPPAAAPAAAAPPPGDA